MSLFAFSGSGRAVSRRVLFQMAIIGFCTGLVKIAGAAKVVFSARAFGVGDDADAYFIAFLVIAFFGDTLAGSLLPALVPTFIEAREAEGRAAAERVYLSAMSCAVVLLSSVAMVLFVAAPWALRPFASHFDAPKLALTSSLFRWMLPMMPLAAIGTAWRAVLNTEERFALPAMIPAATPLVSILFLLWFANTWGVYALAAGSLVGAVLEVSLLGVMMWHRGFAIMPRWFGRTGSLDQLFTQYWPVVAGVWLIGGAPLIDQSIAAMLGSGSVAALQYGTRLTVVLAAVGPGAVATAILPHFSTLIATRDGGEIRRTLRSYATIILAVTLPAIVVLMFISEPLARLFFQRGNFTGTATEVVAMVQRYALLQIPFAMLMALVVRLISSMKMNSLLPRAAVLAAAINLIASLVLIRWMGVAGIALGSAIAQAASLVYLVLLIRTRLPASFHSSPRTEVAAR